jgi:hypothetical protein
MEGWLTMHWQSGRLVQSDNITIFVEDKAFWIVQWKKRFAPVNSLSDSRGGLCSMTGGQPNVPDDLATR